MIVELAQEKLKGLQLSGAALDQRCTQAAAFELAAAAISGALLAVDSASCLTKLLAASSCAVFVAGAALAFLGVRSGKQHLPGVEASWWYPAINESTFTEAQARSWIAGYFEDAIIHNIQQDAKRSRGLNASLIASLVAGVLIAAAAFSRLSA